MGIRHKRECVISEVARTITLCASVQCRRVTMTLWYKADIREYVIVDPFGEIFLERKYRMAKRIESMLWYHYRRPLETEIDDAILELSIPIQSPAARRNRLSSFCLRLPVAMTESLHLVLLSSSVVWRCILTLLRSLRRER